jgi:hypothetical protein
MKKVTIDPNSVTDPGALRTEMRAANGTLKAYKGAPHGMSTIVNDAAFVTIEEDPKGFRLSVRISANQRPVPRQRYAFDLMTFLSFCRWYSSRLATDCPGDDLFAFS